MAVPPTSMPVPPLPRFFLVTDEARGDPQAAAAALPRGAGVILRHYADPHRALLAADLARLCRARRLLLLVADAPGLAARVGAHGVHLPEFRLKPRNMAQARRLPASWRVTAAAHSLAALRRARSSAQAVLLSPVFATASHPGAPALGPVRFAALCRGAGLPVYALGGMDAAAARRLRGAGAYGVAASTPSALAWSYAGPGR